MERIRRRYYIIATIVIGLLQLYVGRLIMINLEKGVDSYYLLVFFILITIISLVIARGRLQDINRNGWLALLLLIPLFNLVVVIPLIFQDGTKGMNKYGWDPKLRKKPIPKHWENYGSNIEVKKSNDDIFSKKMAVLDESKSLGLINSDDYEIKKNELKKEKLKEEQRRKIK